jgi:DNA polymerase III epsilon subunit-like protein
LDYVVFDFETGGFDPGHNEAIQVAGKAYNARTLEPYPAEQGGEFCSLMKPLYFDRLEDGALKVNKKTREELMVAPDQGVVWNQFVDWVGRWNPKKTKWTAPIACGKNIRGFDLKFVTVLNNLHCKKKDKTVLFSERREVDMQDFTFAWFENEAEPEDDKMDTWRKYFGLSTDGVVMMRSWTFGRPGPSS